MKRWFWSKTIWVNVLAIVALIAQSFLGYAISAETQVAILGIINVGLRAITGDEVTW